MQSAKGIIMNWKQNMWTLLQFRIDIFLKSLVNFRPNVAVNMFGADCWKSFSWNAYIHYYVLCYVKLYLLSTIFKMQM